MESVARRTENVVEVVAQTDSAAFPADCETNPKRVGATTHQLGQDLPRLPSNICRPNDCERESLGRKQKDSTSLGRPTECNSRSPRSQDRFSENSRIAAGSRPAH